MFPPQVTSPSTKRPIIQKVRKGIVKLFLLDGSLQKLLYGLTLVGIIASVTTMVIFGLKQIHAGRLCTPGFSDLTALSAS